MIRTIFYLGLVIALGASVYWKIGVIKEKRNAPTISINNEFKKHGKPVETYQVKKDELKLFERVTGEYLNRRVELMVSKIQWNKIQKGQETRIFTQSNGLVDGSVSYKANAPDTNTGLYRVLVRAGTTLMASPGSNVVVDVNTKTLRNVITVPSASIERQGKEAFVWMLTDEGKAVKRPVKRGEESQMFTQIAKGLKVGEEIIVRGASSLEKGDVARIVSGEEK